MKSIVITMKKRLRVSILACLLSVGFVSAPYAKELRVFTWEGYVLPHEVKEVNKILKAKGYDYHVKVIKEKAEGPEQMFKVMRSGKADITFLTLNYLHMQKKKTLSLLQPINTTSPRLSNYKHLNPALTHLAMGMDGKKAYYVAWGGGAYGLWANMDLLKEHELPKSYNDLLNKKWKGRLSLSRGQIQPNIAIAALMAGLPPFVLHDERNNRKNMGQHTASHSPLHKKLNALYNQVSLFWEAEPSFKKPLLIVASYGPGVSAHNAKGNNWKLINFKEGNTVWLDTINFSKELNGKKLEAAEIFLNYFIGPKVQNRVAQGLGMVAASALAEANPLLDKNPDFFKANMFWPPYNHVSDNAMHVMSKRAMKTP